MVASQRPGELGVVGLGGVGDGADDVVGSDQGEVAVAVEESGQGCEVSVEQW
jgi:hypothetical protein